MIEYAEKPATNQFSVLVVPRVLATAERADSRIVIAESVNRLGASRP